MARDVLGGQRRDARAPPVPAGPRPARPAPGRAAPPGPTAPPVQPRHPARARASAADTGLENNGTASGDSELKTAGLPPPAVRSNRSVAGGWKTCRVPRRTWLDSKIDVFLEDLAASGMHLDRQRAGELITGQVRAVAALLRVTGQPPAPISATRSSRTWPGGCCSRSPGTARRRPDGGAADRSAVAGAGGDHRRGPGRGNAGTGGKRAARSPGGRHHHLRAGAVRVRADHRRAAPEQAAPPGTDPGSCWRCCAVRPGTSAAPPTWLRTAANSRTGFPIRHAASWPRPCAEMLTD